MARGTVPIAAVLLALALATLPALGAEWVEISGKRTWDKSAFGFCRHMDQCLVDPAGDPANDNQTLKYFTGVKKPQCVTHRQAIKNWYCEQGNWTARSRPIAMLMLERAAADSPGEYAVFCGPYTDALNYVSYVSFESISNYFDPQKCASVPAGQTALREPTINCANEVCVLRAGSLTMFGASSNVAVDHDRGLLRALNLSKNTCSNVAASAENFTTCNDGRVLYSPSLNSVIYVLSGAVPAVKPLDVFVARLQDAWHAIKGFLGGITDDSKPYQAFGLLNMTPPQYLKLYAAKSGSREILAFWDKTQEPDGPKEYLGVRYAGISLGSEACATYLQAFDPKAFCEQQAGDFFIASRLITGEPGAARLTPLNRAFNDVSAKLRLG